MYVQMEPHVTYSREKSQRKHNSTIRLFHHRKIRMWIIWGSCTPQTNDMCHRMMHASLPIYFQITLLQTCKL